MKKSVRHPQTDCMYKDILIKCNKDDGRKRKMQTLIHDLFGFERSRKRRLEAVPPVADVAKS